MADYDNTNRGMLSANTRREKDTQPEYTGSLNVEGVEYWLNGWIKERKDGSGKFFSISIKKKEDSGKRYSAPASNRPLAAELNDEVPF